MNSRREYFNNTLNSLYYVIFTCYVNWVGLSGDLSYVYVSAYSHARVCVCVLKKSLSVTCVSGDPNYSKRPIDSMYSHRVNCPLMTFT